jgi:hypothetical protein
MHCYYTFLVVEKTTAEKVELLTIRTPFQSIWSDGSNFYLSTSPEALYKLYSVQYSVLYTSKCTEIFFIKNVNNVMQTIHVEQICLYYFIRVWSDVVTQKYVDILEIYFLADSFNKFKKISS